MATSGPGSSSAAERPQMRHAEIDTAVRREHQREAGSFLVRVWYEPGEGDPAFRGYVRNLQTGEERLLGEPSSITQEIVRQSGAPAVHGSVRREPRAPKNSDLPR